MRYSHGSRIWLKLLFGRRDDGSDLEGREIFPEIHQGRHRVCFTLPERERDDYPLVFYFTDEELDEPLVFTLYFCEFLNFLHHYCFFSWSLGKVYSHSYVGFLMLLQSWHS